MSTRKVKLWKSFLTGNKVAALTKEEKVIREIAEEFAEMREKVDNADNGSNSYTKEESDERYLTEIPDNVALKSDIPEIPTDIATEAFVTEAITTAITGAMEASY